MFDQMRNAYDQMQPGDKMVMQLHKSQTPPTPTYRKPEPVGRELGGPMPGGPVDGPPPSGPAGPIARPSGPMPLPYTPPAGATPGWVPSATPPGLDPLIAAMRSRFSPR